MDVFFSPQQFERSEIPKNAVFGMDEVIFRKTQCSEQSTQSNSLQSTVFCTGD